MAFTFPIASTASSLVSQAVSSTGQKIMDYAAPTASKLAGEMLNKLGASGITDKFKSASASLGLTKMNGSTIATPKGAAAAALGNAGKVVKAGQLGGVPASATAAESNSGKTDRFKVTLTASPAIGSAESNIVVFDIMPTIDESRAATYDNVDILHHPGKILKYKGTEARSWRITADLVSRTKQEADTNLQIMNTIRSWVMPFYGEGTAAAYPDKLGAPPQIITLKAYGEKMIGPVSCVLNDYNWIFENDRDYVETTSGVPFPVHLKVSLNLTETWTPAEFTKFDLSAYRDGLLPAAFTGAAPEQASPGTTGGNPVGGAGGVDPSEMRRLSNRALAAAGNQVSGLTAAAAQAGKGVGAAVAGAAAAGKQVVANATNAANGLPIKPPGG